MVADVGGRLNFRRKSIILVKYWQFKRTAKIESKVV